MAFNLGQLYRLVKNSAKNPKISDNILFNSFLGVFLAHVTSPNGNKPDWFQERTRISEIINNKVDVPKKFRNVQFSLIDQKHITDDMRGFIDQYLLTEALPEMVTNVLNLAHDKPEIYKNLSSAKDDEAAFLMEALISAVRENNRAHQGTLTYQRGSEKLLLISGTLFSYAFGTGKKQPNIVVIPVDTTFDLEISTPNAVSIPQHVSPKSLHGQWIIRMEKAGVNLDELKNRVNEGIGPEFNSVGEGSARYPIGAISVVSTDKDIFYLLAVSDFDERGVATSSVDDIRLAVSSLLDFYNVHGQGFDMYMPLIGSGLSRTGLTNKDSYSLIKNAIQEFPNQMAGNLHVVVKPEIVSELEA